MKTILFFITLTLIAGCGQKNVTDQSEAHLHGRNMDYTCPMHPQIQTDKPGLCPICNMQLVKKTNSAKPDEHLISLSENQVLLANIKTENNNSQPTASKSIFLTGRVIYNPLKKESISARVAGRITKLYVKETGKNITAGQKLYDLYSEELLATQQELLIAAKEAEILKSASVNWSSQIERIKRKLMLWGLSVKQIEGILKSRKTNAYLPIYSKVNGVVTEKLKNEGDFLNEGEAVFSIAGANSFWLEAEVYDEEKNLFVPEKAYDVSVEGFPNIVFKGYLAFSNQTLQGNSRLNILSLALKKTNYKLVPGMQAKITINSLMQKKSHRNVPSKAIIYGEKENYIWVMTKNNHFKRQIVKLGESKGTFTEVLNGLNVTDNVVTSGVYLLNSEYKLRFGY